MLTTADNFASMTPAGLLFTLVVGLLIVVVPRKYILLPIGAAICYMTGGQYLVVMGLHFPIMRILILCGWVRLVLRGEFRRIRLNSLDRLILWWVFSAVVTYMLLWQTKDALVWRLILAYNALGTYFLFRMLFRSLEDVDAAVRFLAVLLPPLAAIMCVEKVTGRNPFAVFGGVFEISWIRDGVVRCQGPFGHAILAGTFAASLFPIFVGLWWRRKGFTKLLSACGIMSAGLITALAGSSGPVFAFVAGTVGLGLWSLRRYMSAIRWGLLLILVALSLFMKAPVWFLIAHLSAFNGSDAWHRAYLIDRAFANFSDWWLIGTRSTEAWGPSLHDVTNAYIESGATGGLITMVLFIAIIVYSFRFIGRSVRIAEGIRQPRTARFVWGMGASLLVHSVTFISVTYFDQNVVNWFLLLAMISVAAESLKTAKSEYVCSTYSTPEDASASSALVNNESRPVASLMGDWN